MKKTLILGGTGFLGSYIINELHQNEYSIFVCANETSDTSHIDNMISGLIKIDLDSEKNRNIIIDFILQNNIDSIIYCIGKVDYKTTFEKSYDKNIRPLLNFIKLFNPENNISRCKIIFISSVAQRGFQKKKDMNNLITESGYPFYKPGKSLYSDIKFEAHKIMLDAILNGFNAVIVEPTSLVGKPIGNTSTTNYGLIRKIVKGFPVLSGGACYSSVRKTAEGIRLALEKGVIGETYIIGGCNMKMKNFSLLVNKTNEINKLNFILPVFLSKFLGFFNLILSKEQAKIGNLFSFASSKKAESELGYKHTETDLILAIRETLGK